MAKRHLPQLSPDQGAWLLVVSLFQNIRSFARSVDRIPPGMDGRAGGGVGEGWWWSSSVQESEGNRWEGTGSLETGSFLEHHRSLQKCPGFWVKKKKIQKTQKSVHKDLPSV